MRTVYIHIYQDRAGIYKTTLSQGESMLNMALFTKD